MTGPKISNRAKQIAIGLGMGTAIFLSIGFAKREQIGREMRGVTIGIENQFENYFIDEQEIMNIVAETGFDTTSKVGLGTIELRDLELALERERFIEDAQFYRDLSGTLVIITNQRRPIARIIRKNAPDAYVAEDASILPVSQKFTSRVMLISGSFADSLIADENMLQSHEQYFHLIDFINQDPFWKAQIAQIDIDAFGDVTLYPQVTKQVVEFGGPENVADKFEKLEVFLKKILPFKGWNSYKRVSLQYEGQIICE